MNKDVHLLEERYNQIHEGMLGDTIKWGANKLAGTKMGKNLGNKLISKAAQDASPEGLQWLADNIDNPAALKQRISQPLSSEPQNDIQNTAQALNNPDSTALANQMQSPGFGGDLLQQILSQPNLKQIVKDYLVNNGYTAAEPQPQQKSAPDKPPPATASQQEFDFTEQPPVITPIQPIDVNLILDELRALIAGKETNTVNASKASPEQLATMRYM
jgi:hypothetical protein